MFLRGSWLTSTPGANKVLCHSRRRRGACQASPCADLVQQEVGDLRAVDENQIWKVVPDVWPFIGHVHRAELGNVARCFSRVCVCVFVDGTSLSLLRASRSWLIRSRPSM